jgi:beta-aspartyl-dipeptidase (metallo-type)|tara:strand:+ start:905 stop:2092 length:1188 start_codon:yes stop_codon:yes gene_type:complete
MAMFELITNARIYSPASLGMGCVLTCAGKIVYIGQSKPELGSGLEVQVTDVKGRMLLPGLVDGHAHITGGGGETGYSSKVPPVPLSEFTGAGVTSVIGLTGTDDVTRSTSALIAATMALREEGLNAWCYTGGYHYPLNLLTDSALNDLVHIECVIGIGELAISDHRSSHMTFDELVRVASEAHVGGLMTGKAGLLHLHLGDGRRGLQLVREAIADAEVPARIYHPTHVNRLKRLFDEACGLVLEGCHIDLTAFPVNEDPSDDQSVDKGYGIVEAVTRYIDKNLPIEKLTVSSDGGGCLPEFDQQGVLLKLDFARCQSLPIALGELLAAGVDTEQAISFFTKNAAQLYRLQGKGIIAVGADADLVALDDQFQVSDVMCRGVWHKKSGRQLKKGLFE